MKIPTVKKFFGCLDLTIGGLVLGYIGAITNAAYLLILLNDLILDFEKFKMDVYEFAESIEKLSPVEAVVEEFVTAKPVAQYSLPLWIFVMLAVTLVTILLVCCIISLWFIQGVKNRDPRKVRYFLVIMAIGICSSFIKGALSLSFQWILVGMINVYCFICVFSLHQVLESDMSELALKSTNNASQCEDDAESGTGGYQTTEFNRP